jgi:hypothetical protein
MAIAATFVFSDTACCAVSLECRRPNNSTRLRVQVIASTCNQAADNYVFMAPISAKIDGELSAGGQRIVKGL